MFLSKNRRRQFRVSLINPIPGYFEIEYFEGKIYKTLLISILDISINGMKIKSPYYLPVNRKVIFHVYFKVAQVEFGLASRLVWHKLENGELFYGFEFFEKAQSVERKLIECLKKHQEKSWKQLGGAMEIAVFDNDLGV